MISRGGGGGGTPSPERIDNIPPPPPPQAALQRQRCELWRSICGRSAKPQCTRSPVAYPIALRPCEPTSLTIRGSITLCIGTQKPNPIVRKRTEYASDGSRPLWRRIVIAAALPKQQPYTLKRPEQTNTNLGTTKNVCGGRHPRLRTAPVGAPGSPEKVGLRPPGADDRANI